MVRHRYWIFSSIVAKTPAIVNFLILSFYVTTTNLVEPHLMSMYVILFALHNSLGTPQICVALNANVERDTTVAIDFL